MLQIRIFFRINCIKFCSLLLWKIRGVLLQRDVIYFMFTKSGEIFEHGDWLSEDKRLEAFKEVTVSALLTDRDIRNVINHFAKSLTHISVYIDLFFTGILLICLRPNEVANFFQAKPVLNSPFFQIKNKSGVRLITAGLNPPKYLSNMNEKSFYRWGGLLQETLGIIFYFVSLWNFV